MSSVESGIDNFLYFPFGFSVYDFRWGSFIVGSVRLGISVLRQEVYVKDRVNFHGCGKYQLIGDRR